MKNHDKYTVFAGEYGKGPCLCRQAFRDTARVAYIKALVMYPEHEPRVVRWPKGKGNAKKVADPVKELGAQ